ncbi:MAG: diaminopimelate epimerase [Hyphomicrobiales bacterium]
MKIHFYKYHGTGNDFIMIDNRENRFPQDPDIITNLCHRRFGIGADGLILLQNHSQYDFNMVYFNSDGHQSSMCGNGGRCIVAFAYHLGIIKDECKFEAIDGEHSASIISSNKDQATVKLRMQDVNSISHSDGEYFLNTGSPHVVKLVDNVNCYDVNKHGKDIRNSEKYAPHGTNVNFIEKSGDKLIVRTFERGVEEETWSCGTGVTAASIVLSTLEDANEVNIITKGGELKVYLEKEKNLFTNLYLQGPAVKTFEGITII